MGALASVTLKHPCAMSDSTLFQRKDQRDTSNRKEPGFVLADLVLSLGIGAVLLSTVWPGQSTARIASDKIASNEGAASAALRSIVHAQAKLVSSGAIDTDDDGVGEYGYFGELAGTALLRIYNPVPDAPDLGDRHLTPPLLPIDFANIYFEYANYDCVLLRNGYASKIFKMILPDVEQFHIIEGIGEDGPIGIGGTTGVLFPDPDTGEKLWCCSRKGHPSA